MGRRTGEGEGAWSDSLTRVDAAVFTLQIVAGSNSGLRTIYSDNSNVMMCVCTRSAGKERGGDAGGWGMRVTRASHNFRGCTCLA